MEATTTIGTILTSMTTITIMTTSTVIAVITLTTLTINTIITIIPISTSIASKTVTAINITSITSIAIVTTNVAIIILLLLLRGTPHPVVVTIRENGADTYIRVTITGWGVHPNVTSIAAIASITITAPTTMVPTITTGPCPPSCKGCRRSDRVACHVPGHNSTPIP